MFASVNWSGHAYCLVTNHYRLLPLRLADGKRRTRRSWPKGCGNSTASYTRRFNVVHGCCGHFFQGRYKAILIQKETYLTAMARYIALNPVRAGMVGGAEDWPFSRYGATTGEAACPQWLRRDWLVSAFGATEQAAAASYRRLVAEGIGQAGPWE